MLWMILNDGIDILEAVENLALTGTGYSSHNVSKNFWCGNHLRNMSIKKLLKGLGFNWKSEILHTDKREEGKWKRKMP